MLQNPRQYRRSAPSITPSLRIYFGEHVDRDAKRKKLRITHKYIVSLFRWPGDACDDLHRPAAIAGKRRLVAILLGIEL